MKLDPVKDFAKRTTIYKQYAPCLTAHCFCKVNHSMTAHKDCNWICGRCKHKHTHHEIKFTQFNSTHP